MTTTGRILRAVLWGSAATGVFLAFGWPFVVSADPAGGAFRVIATGTLVLFLLSLVALVALKAMGEHRSTAKEG